MGAHIILKKAGYHVSDASDIKTALQQQIQQRHFDAIITDLGLPDGNGLDIVKAYRALERETNCSKIPVFALTGHAVNTVKEACIAAGVDQVFIKPLNAKTLEDIQFWLTPLTQSDQTTVQMSDVLFNVEEARILLGDDLTDLVRCALNESLPVAYSALQTAYDQKNWEQIKYDVHKLKGTSSYIGASRLYQACIALEHDTSNKETQKRERLLKQLLQIIEETKQALQIWLKQSSAE